MTRLGVAVLQTPAHEAEDAPAAWAQCLRRIDDAASDGPDVIVLPEASASGWFLAHHAGMPPYVRDEDAIAALAERARTHGAHIVAGLVLGWPHAPQNAALHISPDGVEVARAAEASPAPWFRPGRGPVPTRIDVAGAGAVATVVGAGADLLDPRWVELIASDAMQLAISTGASRAGDATPATLASRAAELGAWVIAAGRTGVESGAVVYAGGAGVVTPRGEWAVHAPPDRAGIALHTLEVEAAEPRVGAVPDDAAARPQPAAGGTARVAAIAIDPVPSAVDLMEAVRAGVRTAAALGARLVVLPDLTGPDPRAITQAETLPLLEALSADAGVVLVASIAQREDAAVYRAVSVIERGDTLATHRQTVVTLADTQAGFVADTVAPPVVRSAAGAVGVLGGVEAATPAAVASLRRRGAQVIAWCAGGADFDVQAVALTRAREQHLPVLAAGASTAGAHVVEAGGRLLAATSPGAYIAHAEVEQQAVG